MKIAQLSWKETIVCYYEGLQLICFLNEFRQSISFGLNVCREVQDKSLSFRQSKIEAVLDSIDGGAVRVHCVGRRGRKARASSPALEETENLPDFDADAIEIDVETTHETDSRLRVSVTVTYPFETVVDWPGLPPDFNLRPPEPGAPGPVEQDTSAQAEEILTGQQRRIPTEAVQSQGEIALLDRSQVRADPGIRQILAQEDPELVEVHALARKVGEPRKRQQLFVGVDIEPNMDSMEARGIPKDRGQRLREVVVDDPGVRMDVHVMVWVEEVRLAGRMDGQRLDRR